MKNPRISKVNIAKEIAKSKPDCVWLEAETNNFIELCEATLFFHRGEKPNRASFNTFDRYFRLVTVRQKPEINGNV